MVYFNSAAGAYPLAPGVADAVSRTLGEPPRVSGRDSVHGADGLRDCRRKIAELLEADPAEVVLTNGATYALNAAILGLGLSRGDTVVTTVAEHNSVLRPLAYIEDRAGVNVEYIPLDGDFRLDTAAYAKLLETKPRLVVITHASNVTGRINPVNQLFEAAKSVGAVTLLDASQTVGRILVRPAELHADMVAFPGYKGLRGSPGTGALYVSPDVALEPVFTGGTGVKSDLRLMPPSMPALLEPGTPNTPAFAGLAAAVGYYLGRVSEVQGTEAAMTERLLAGLRNIPRIRVFDGESANRLPVVSFAVDGVDAETAGFALTDSFGIGCRAGLHCAPLIHKVFGVRGTVRLSPSYANTFDEIDYVLNAVDMVASTGRNAD